MLRYCVLINRTTIIDISTSDDFDTLEGLASFTAEETTLSKPQSLSPNPPQGGGGDRCAVQVSGIRKGYLFCHKWYINGALS